MAKPTVYIYVATPARLLQYAENILAGMSENKTLFPSPDPALANLESALILYRKTIAEAAFRDTRLIVLRKQKQSMMKQMLYDLALYVDKIAKGDRGVILAAGFIPTKDNRTSVVPPFPENFRVVLSEIGGCQVQLCVKTWRLARFYRFEYRKLEADTPWQMVLSSRSRCILTNLERRQDYEFRVAYMGTDPTITYSDVICKFVY